MNNLDFKLLESTRLVVSQCNARVYIFGTNIVYSGNLTYTNGDFPVSHYDLVFEDIASNKLGITLQAKTTNTEYLIDIGSDYQKVAQIQLNIIGISNELPVSWEDFSGDYENLYVEESTGYIKEFDCIKVVFGVACEIDVTDFEPAVAAAGVGEVSVNGVKGVVTIRGSGFMNAPVGQPTPEGRYVKFSTIGGGWIAPLEGDYISWTDNEIKVKVPSIGYDDNSKNIITDLNTQNACTGKIRVCKDTKILFATIPCGCNDDTNTKLYVPFSARNTYMTGTTGLKNSVRTLLRIFNGSGGYTIYFTKDFKNYMGAVDAYKRALTTWRCATQVNFDIDEISDPPAPGDGICVVEFWNLPVGTTSVTRGATLFSPLSCGGSSNFSYLKDFRMRFNKNLTWHTGVNKPPLDWEVQGDLESTALHEIGHAHLLNHTCNTLNVMIHPGVSNFRRELTHDDESGGDHVSLLSNHINGPDCPLNPMELTNMSECNINYVFEVNGNKMEIMVFPNPVSETLNIVFIDLNDIIEGLIVVVDILGRPHRLFHISGNQLQADLGSLSLGIYQLLFLTKSGTQFHIGNISKI